MTYDDLAKQLEAAKKVIAAAHGLMSEDDAQEAVLHFNCFFIMRDALEEYDKLLSEIAKEANERVLAFQRCYYPKGCPSGSHDE